MHYSDQINEIRKYFKNFFLFISSFFQAHLARKTGVFRAKWTNLGRFLSLQRNISFIMFFEKVLDFVPKKLFTLEFDTELKLNLVKEF